MSRRLLALLSSFALSAGFAAPAHAANDPGWSPGRRTTSTLRGEVVPEDDRRRGDGVYGRFDGDLSLALGLGVDAGEGLRGAVVGRALYFHTLGLLMAYSDALGSDASIVRVASASLEIRPLFLLRWQGDRALGEPLLDLTLDSLALELGAFAAENTAAEFGEPIGFQAALGFGVPLLAAAQGPWLEARAAYRSGVAGSPFAAVVLLSFYGAVLTPIVR